MPDRDEIFTNVQEILVEALSVDDDEVTPEATLTGDLGAESIDFLDIVFRLEKAFDIKIDRGELFPENLFTDPQFVEDGKVTEAGMEELRRRMPFADLDKFAESPDVKDFPNLFTVETLCRFVEHKVRLGRKVGRVFQPVWHVQQVSNLLYGRQPWRHNPRLGNAMRWYWIDRFREFESGRSAVAVKNISLAEEHLHDHFPGNPVMPCSLIVEGFAQLGGILVSEATGLRGNMILAKVPKAVFHRPARPGDTLFYRGTIEYLNDEGAMVTGQGHCGGELQAEVDVFFANVKEGERARNLFTAGELLAMMKLLGVFEVGVDQQGNKLQVPDWLTGKPAADPAAIAGRA